MGPRFIDDRAEGEEGDVSDSDSDADVEQPNSDDYAFLDDAEDASDGDLGARADAESYMRARDRKRRRVRGRGRPSKPKTPRIFADDSGDQSELEDRREAAAFPLSEEIAKAAERRAEFLREQEERRNNREDRTGFTPERRARPSGSGSGSGSDQGDDQGSDPAPEIGSLAFREAMRKIKCVYEVLKALAERDPREVADTVVEDARVKLEALGEAHTDARIAARSQDEMTALTDLSRRAQMIGHSVSCIAKHISNINSAIASAPRDADVVIHSVEQFVGYEDLYSDKGFTPFHQLLEHVMSLFRAAGLRREGEDAYAKVYTEAGHPTVAWARKYSIADFVNLHVRKSVNIKMWLIKAKEKNPVPRIVDHLCSSNEAEFSDVNSLRTLFSFENGVYDAENNEFHAYPLARESPLMAKGAPSAGNHFAGVEFPVADYERLKGGDHIHYKNIDTGVLDSVLEYQEIPPEAIEWLYFSIGRMIYPISEYDDLQYFLFFDGAAGCGKSTIIKVIQALYDKAKVGIVSNNIETTFGLSSLYDKWICVAPEIKHDWRISVTEFQSMASGESVSIAVKNKNTVQELWTAPVALAGNEVPGFNDLAGSVSRRLLVYKFVNKPEREDATLLARILGVMGHIILKANFAYRYMTANGCDSSLWDRVPEYFTDIRAEVQRSINPLIDFMESGKFVHDDATDSRGRIKYKVGFQDFKDLAKDFVKEKHGGKKLDERAFELHKVKPILKQYKFEFEYEKRPSGRDNKSRLSAILCMREYNASDALRNDLARGIAARECGTQAPRGARDNVGGGCEESRATSPGV